MAGRQLSRIWQICRRGVCKARNQRSGRRRLGSSCMPNSGKEVWLLTDPRWLAAIACLMTLVAALEKTRAHAQAPEICSEQYLLDNDEAYWSEVNYTISETCRLKLSSELRGKSPSSVVDRYVLAKLLPQGSHSPQAAAAFAQLCEAEGYARACSATALSILAGHFGTPAQDLLRFLEPAVKSNIPSAQVLMGEVRLIQFQKTRAQGDLCEAARLWRRAGAMGDSAGKRRLEWLVATFGTSCDES